MPSRLIGDCSSFSDCVAARQTSAYAEELLGLVGLAAARDVPAELLAHGQQRQLEVAMALGARPQVLLLDEPSSGMSAHERQGLGELLKVVAQKATVVMAEHDVPLVRNGGDPSDGIQRGKEEWSREPPRSFFRRRRFSGSSCVVCAMFELEDLHSYYGKSHVVQGIGLTVDTGEAVGLVGRNGVGKTTTLKSIMGMLSQGPGADSA